MTKEHQSFRAVKGMADILPPASALWQRMESTARRVFETYGYREIRTPLVEQTQLFRRGVGETTSIVEKEMYSFTDQGGESLTLRPEGTASVVRAYLESGAYVAEPVAHYYYVGPMFRRERPQKGRQRQFFQIGCELLGAESPLADAETIAMCAHFLEEVGAGAIELEINSLGCAACRPAFNEALAAHLHHLRPSLCEDCSRRLERNPLRVLDCKRESCQALLKNAPSISIFWCQGCRDHFAAVQRSLAILHVPSILNEKIVRGLDYYVRTAFEFTSARLGAQSAISAGGRYDGLVAALGGPDVPGVGFALGLERLALLLDETRSEGGKQDIVFFAILGERAQEATFPIIQTLRRDGVRVEWNYACRSLKTQMRRAGKIGAETVVIVGDDEVGRGHAIVRDMRAATQREVRLADLPMHFVRVEG